jgi:hypothetical protein
MSRLRTAGIVLLVAVLAVDILAASALVAVDRTVLNPSFVTTSLEEENAYQHAEPIVLAQLAPEELEGTGNETPPLPIDPQVVAEEAVDPEYPQSQLEPNIERTYAYLHGNADELELIIELEPAKSAIVDTVEAELIEMGAVELFRTVAGEGNDLSVEAEGITIDLVTVAEMAADESAFQAERAELRDAIRQRILEQAVDEAFTEASHDQLLELVIEGYNPDDYTEEEKQQLVEDNEAEIRTALRDLIEAERGDEIDAEVERQLAETREAIRSNVSGTVNEKLGDADPAIAEPVTELTLVAVDGYVADISHDEFSSGFDSAVEDLAAGVATVIEAELDEQVPDRVDLTDQLDSAAVDDLEQARQVVGIIDLLAVLLPIVGVGLIGLLYFVYRSVTVTAMGGGLGLTIGGLPTLVGASQVEPQLRNALGGAGLPPGFRELLLAITGQVANAVLVQSGLVVGVGTVAFGAGLALHLGVLELPSMGDST